MMKKIAAAAALVGALTLGAAMQAAAQQSTGANNQHALHGSTPPAATHAGTATNAHATAATHHATPARGHGRVAESTARTTALAAVANGRVRSHTLTRVSGRTAYVYVISVPGKPGSERVAVDVQTGRIMSQTHQAPAATKHSAAPAHRHG
jgi:hypothetical protein